MKDEDFTRITETIVIYERIAAPIEAGEELGMIVYKLNEKEIGKIPLLSKEEIVKSGYWDYIKELLKLLT